jgi:hypothetical protein
MAIKKINPDDFRVGHGKTVDLAKWPTKGKPVYSSKEEYGKILSEHIEQLSEQQNLLYGSNLWLQSLCAATDFSSHGRGWEGQRH